jgi:hypothetical protein
MDKDLQHFIPVTMTFQHERRSGNAPICRFQGRHSPGRARGGAGGNQMGGMMGMMGGGAVPNLKKLDPEDASSRSIIAGIPTRSRQPTEDLRFLGNAICASRRTSATMIRREHRPSCLQE